MVLMLNLWRRPGSNNSNDLRRRSRGGVAASAGGGASLISAKHLSEYRKSAGSPSVSVHVCKRRKNLILL